MADTMPKVRRYVMVARQYGGSSVAIEGEDGVLQVIGDIALPRGHDVSTACCEKPDKAGEAKAKARAAEEKKFSDMVLRHLNDGLAMESGRKRLERTKGNS